MPMSNALSLANFKAPLKGILKPWDFDLDEITFTASMAKRATGVFATAPIVQGNWAGGPTPDAVTFPRGGLLGNQAQEWYGNLDPYQGSIVLWITPEWDGDDGKSHYFIAGGSGMIFGLSLYKNAANELVLQSDITELVAVDISAWAAGTTYCVIASWDTKNVIAITDYARISINNVHTYDQTSAFSPTSNATIRIGSAFTAGIQTSPANAILEGLTIYRRVLWDGTYGKDVGNGIETTLIYAAGAGADPCLITGSWDVVLCVPTDSTAGALVTGTGEAWSHPHGSALPTHAFVDDGFGPHQESAILFNENDTNVDLTSNLAVDDMPDGANGFQVGCWARIDGGAADFLMNKYTSPNGWYIRPSFALGRFEIRVGCLTTAAITSVYFSDNPQWGEGFDGKWHWILMSFHHVDNGGDSTIYVQLDGKWATTYDTQTAGVGAYLSDAALNLTYGRATGTFLGAGGWLALWNDVTTYPVGTDNIAPRTKPGAGGNLIEAWQCDDRVNAITATVTTPGNDGLLANGLWERKFNVEATPIVPQSVAMTAGDIDFGSGVNIDDLPPAGFTAEGWFRCDAVTGANAYFFSKGTTAIGWSIFINGTGELRGFINYAGGDASLDANINLDDGIWHHVALTDDGVDTAYLWLDGLQVDSDAYAGAYVVDNANSCIAGDYDAVPRPLNGAVGWLRVSNNVRYAADFTPPDRQNPPANDANAHLLINMDDGAGAQATDTSGNAYHGTITAGRWDNTYDMELDSPGARTFRNGYVTGVDGAGDGVGSLVDVTAETDYVIRPVLAPGQDSRGLWYVYVWDDIGGAQIGTNYQMPSYHGAHTGGAASPTLDDNTARWPQSLIGAIALNITQATNGAITAIDGDMQSLTAGINWNNGDEYRIFWVDGYHNHLWAEPFVVRTPAACVRMDVRILSSDGEGTLYAHQVEVQESLIDNGCNEAGAGNPWIPTGWANGDLDAGDTQTSSTGGAMIHSGAECIQWNVGAVAAEYMSVNALAGAVGDFFMMGGWAYGDGGTANIRLYPLNAARAVLQYSTTDYFLEGPTAAYWQRMVGVYRETHATYTPRMQSNGAPAANRYSDDVYLFLLDPVTLTITPASAANSLESSGIRIDGYDTGTQPIPAGAIRANRGLARWTWRPRHAAALLAGFGNTTAPTLLHAWGNATNYIHVYATAANNIRLEFNDGGGVHQVNWNCAGLVAVDTAYIMEVRWNPGRMQLYQDGAMRVEIVQPVSFATIPTIAYWGSQQAGDEQIDAVFGAP